MHEGIGIGELCTTVMLGSQEGLEDVTNNIKITINKAFHFQQNPITINRDSYIRSQNLC